MFARLHTHRGISGEFFREQTLITTDPPAECQLRAVVVPSFSPTAMARMEATLRAFTAEIIDAAPGGEPIDVVEEVAAVLPVESILTVIGIDPAYVAELKHWSDEGMKSGSALAEEDIRAAKEGAAAMASFLNEWIAASAIPATT